MESKQIRLRNAIIKFKESDQTAEDYFNLFVTVHGALQFGHGLLWTDVEAILQKEITNDNIVKHEAKNRVRLMIKNLEFAKARGYTLFPTQNEIEALNLLIRKSSEKEQGV